MKRALQREIEVWADWEALGQPIQMGTLTATPAEEIRWIRVRGNC